MRRRKIVPSFALFSFFVMALPAFGQTAYWNGGTGNWSNPNQWDCYNPYFSACVPSTGFAVFIGPSNSTVTLDVNATVNSVTAGNSGSSASMTIRGTSLTTTGGQAAAFNVLNVNSGGSITTATETGVIANTVIANNASLNTGLAATNVTLTNGSNLNGTSVNGLSLEVDNNGSNLGNLTLANSRVGRNGTSVTGGFSISRSSVTGAFSFDAESNSTVTNSTFTSFGGTVGPGVSLDVQNSNLGSSRGSLRVMGGTATLEQGTTYYGVSVLTLGTANGFSSPGTLTLNGSGTTLTLTNTGAPQVLVDASGSTQATLKIQNSAKLLAGTDPMTQVTIGHGLLNITSGGQVSVPITTVNGSILVDGNGSSLKSTTSLVLASSGGILVQNAANVQVGALFINTGAGGSLSLFNRGGLTYSGMNAVFAPNPLASEAPLYIAGGSSLVGRAGQSGADSFSGDATITGYNSSWQPNSGLNFLGGTLSVLAGGQLNAGAGNVFASGNSRVIVAGPISTVSANIFGLAGSSALNISGAGQLNAAYAIDIGPSASATVSDYGAKVQAQIANVAGGTLMVTNNGTLSLGSGSNNLLTVNEGGQLLIQNSGTVKAGILDVTQGSVKVASGGQLSAEAINLGISGGSATTASLTISDTGTLARGLLDPGTGRVTIENGSTFAISNGASVTVGANPVGVAVVTVDAGGTLDARNGSLTIGLAVPSAPQGDISLNVGGTLRIAHPFANSAGLRSNVLVGQVLYNGGGLVSLDPATLSLSGSYVQTAGEMDLEIDGTQPGQFDQLIAGGSIQLSGGKVEFDFANGFAPIAGETFDLMSAAGGISISDTNFLIEGLAPGFDYTTSLANGQFDLTALNDGISSGGTSPPPSSTPEPGTWVLMGSALIMLVFLNRLRKSEVAD